MPETKPFMSYPIWSNSKHQRKIWGRHQFHNKDEKDSLGWSSILWNYFTHQRSVIRIIKVCIVFALIIMCAINFKLAIDAKIKYERHTSMLMGPPQVDGEYHDYHHSEPQLFSPHQSTFEIEVLSSKSVVKVAIDDRLVYEDLSNDSGRGLHIVVINQHTADVTATKVFDTYVKGIDETIQTFLNSVNDQNRILVFAIKNEASLNLQDSTKKVIQGLGSKKVSQLSWRGMWAFIGNKKGQLYAENLSAAADSLLWADPVSIKADIEVVTSENIHNCNWPATPENRRREKFCQKYDGYKDLCSCNSDLNFWQKPDNFSNNKVYDVPVVVIACNRPQYLYRMLRTLLSTSGVNQKKIVVFIDGHFEETMAVANLLGVQGIYHEPIGIKNARISQNYKASLTAIFDLYPDSKYTIVLEEDIDVSPDFFKYFSQTIHLIELDPSIYCISAWNDQGYHHSSKDPTLLYRVEGFPGLGWLLSKKLFKTELEPNWPGPDKLWDWDLWMRLPHMRKERECIIPDVSRTFHFGSSGLNMNSYFHQLYFNNHKINNLPDVRLQNLDSLTKDNYEKLMHTLVRQSTVVDHKLSPCDPELINSASSYSNTYVAFISATDETVYGVFIKLFKCLKLWDLDIRGVHRFSFRTFIKERHVVFVAYPLSPYSIYKPVDVNPFKLDPEPQN